MASLTELSFHWTGFISAMISNIAFTYRSIYSKKQWGSLPKTICNTETRSQSEQKNYIGCVVLYTGQGKFHTSTSNTLDYVVWQANTIVESLGSVLDYLEAAKHIRVDQLFLPPDVQNNINKVETDINTAAPWLV
ncbi:hypothetical protein TEA_015231 [Camellia sinensis var. sinensis]|uniref:Sugar phosphate transporter domain-containing protein n=1 Tax=Camellia sinensis var. sinensis TaxID=542762 RepID=A0A4S4DWY8_CAMSN|nr:hypothetical protein TEA_015231 [Camellia sinensis var. sinensis]